MTIEHAVAGDFDSIRTLLEMNQLPVAGLSEHMESTLVAREGGRVIGSAALELYTDGALLRSVAVDASARGRGLGHQLTEAAVTLANQMGAPAVYLLTTTAEGFFPKLGFNVIERAEVPLTVQESVEFQAACPASAVAMRRVLQAPRT